MKKGKSFTLGNDAGKSNDFLSDYLQPGNTKEEKKSQSSISETTTRQTFMIKVSSLEKLKNFVHTKRKYEDYNYSQKQALEDAFSLLFDTLDRIEERPE
ncbi:hypothetical protein [Marinoscillum pacificum]|uniref:hypothetical protein n=1 Tax=Marinoscillum pacificum TaxID=392723 RepID=UPI002157AB32|nr:hypothetical protein [Marinoscillum pacificum]|tara:strand:+ start:113 stop:409 length:297 start_codon:yes stop_codon:yes gene_type:complete